MILSFQPTLSYIKQITEIISIKKANQVKNYIVRSIQEKDQRVLQRDEV